MDRQIDKRKHLLIVIKMNNIIGSEGYALVNRVVLHSKPKNASSDCTSCTK